jgi:hypothetical protein
MAESKGMCWHYAPKGVACCGRRRMKRKVRTRAKWDVIDAADRCNDCDAAVKRDGKPRNEVWIGIVVRNAQTMTAESAARDVRAEAGRTSKVRRA